MDNINYASWYKLGCNQELGIGEFYEFIIQLCYSSVTFQSDVILDGGANRGRHTIPMGRIVGESGLVIGFEAIPILADALEQQCLNLGFSNIRIKQLAISNTEKSTDFVDFHYVQQCDGYSGIRERIGIPDSAKGSGIKIRVPLSRMDAEVEPNLSVRFIKLDLEGGEYHALLGAERIMTKDKPFIIFENGRHSAAEVYGYTEADWFRLFYSREYEVFDLFGRPFTSNLWNESEVPWYFIAVSREEDKHFVNKVLPNLVECIYESTLRTLKTARPSN